MKKTIFGMIVLLLVCSSMAFAQQARQQAPAQAQPAASAGSGERKNAISMDVNYLFRGFIESETDIDTFYFGLAPAYEHLISSRFSIGGEVYTVFGTLLDRDILYIGAGFNARIYLLPDRMDGWFLGATLGFNMLAVEDANGNLKVKPDDGLGFVSLYTNARLGYKLHLAGGFFMEPSLAYTHNSGYFGGMGAFLGIGSGVLDNAGWTAAIRLGFSF